MPRREFRATVDTRSSVADRTDDASMRLTLLLFRRVAAESPALINAHAHDDDAHDDADDLHHLRVPLPNRGEQIARSRPARAREDDRVRTPHDAGIDARGTAAEEEQAGKEKWRRARRADVGRDPARAARARRR